MEGPEAPACGSQGGAGSIEDLDVWGMEKIKANRKSSKTYAPSESNLRGRLTTVLINVQ